MAFRRGLNFELRTFRSTRRESLAAAGWLTLTPTPPGARPNAATPPAGAGGVAHHELKERGALGMDGQHRAGGAFYDLVGDAAEDHLIQPRSGHERP